MDEWQKVIEEKLNEYLGYEIKPVPGERGERGLEREERQ